MLLNDFLTGDVMPGFGGNVCTKWLGEVISADGIDVMVKFAELKLESAGVSNAKECDLLLHSVSEGNRTGAEKLMSIKSEKVLSIVESFALCFNC